MGEKKDNMAASMWAEKTWQWGQAKVPPQSSAMQMHGPSFPCHLLNIVLVCIDILEHMINVKQGYGPWTIGHVTIPSECDLVLFFFLKKSFILNNNEWWKSFLDCKNLLFFFFHASIKIHGYLDDTKACASE